MVLHWLDDNPVGKVLVFVVGGLLLIALFLTVAWILPPSTPSGGGEDEGGEFKVEVPQLPQPPPLERYAVITERPVFNPSRQPELGADDAQDDEEDLAQEEVDAPELELSGVVITPSVRMVTLRPKGTGESLVAFEGQPLEGDYGSWHVSRIMPREITLSSGAGEELQLELQVHDKPIVEPPKPAADKKTAAAEKKARPVPEADGEEPLSRAEEIRRRIAERREELRRAAEAEQDGQADKVPPPDYRQAIQSMINSRNNKAQDENGN